MYFNSVGVKKVLLMKTDRNWPFCYFIVNKNTSRLHTFIPFADSSPPGVALPRPSWVRLNRLRTGVGLFRSTMHKWSLVTSANNRDAAEDQTADHILASCLLYHPPKGTLGLAALDHNTVDWLQRTAVSI